MSRHEEIEEKCDSAVQKNGKTGCPPEARKRHAHMFLFESWDVHPPQEFTAWWSRQSEARQCKAVTAWNCQADRDRFNRWKDGIEEPVTTLSAEETERGNRFLAELFARKEARA